MSNICEKRGFVTIATGNLRYYKLARNLLRSYRNASSNPFPFAILVDKVNEYTEEFDNVIQIDKPHNSYLDKLQLFKYIPYEETIFIDADCLVYSDINKWFDMFKSGGDFSTFGCSLDISDSDRGWFTPSRMREYQKKITFVPNFNGAVYYLRNTKTCEQVFEIANNCAQHYSEYGFNGFESPADEPCLALAMAVCQCHPLNVNEHVFAPKPSRIKTDITIPKAISIVDSGKESPISLIHWSNYLTLKSYYRFEVYQLNHYDAQNVSIINKIFVKYRLGRLLMSYYDVTAFAYRVIRKLKRILGKHCRSNIDEDKITVS